MATKYTSKSEYAKKLLDPRWQKLRLEVLNRDKFTCQCCGATDKTLHAHHTFYRNDAEGPWDYLLSSLVTLCSDCHGEEHEQWNQRVACVLEAAGTAGFRTHVEVERLWDMLTTLARSVSEPQFEAHFEMMIQSYRAAKREAGTL